MQERAQLMSQLALGELLPSSLNTHEINKLILAMTGQPVDINRAGKVAQLSMLEIIAAHKKQQFPQSSLIIDQSMHDCQQILSRTYQKSTIYQFAKYLPFDIIPFLKRIKNQWLP